MTDQKHWDENIIKMMNKSGEEGTLNRQIKDEDEPIDLTQPFVQIGDDMIVFAERNLYEDKLSVFMPQLFKLMSPEMANLKYPSGRRPDHIFTNVEGTVNMAFTYTNTAVDETEIEDFTIEMAKILRKTQKLQKWYGDGVKEHSIPIGYCEFLSPTINLNVYNLMFFVSLDDRAVLCTFNCLDVEMEDWKPVAHQMMASTKIQGGDHV